MKFTNILFITLSVAEAKAHKLRSIGNCVGVNVKTCSDSQCSEDCGSVTMDKLDGLCQTGTSTSSEFTCTPKTFSETKYNTGDCSGEPTDFTLIWGVCVALPNGMYQMATSGYWPNKWKELACSAIYLRKLPTIQDALLGTINLPTIKSFVC